jgi:molybdopterin molybdotransferase
LSGLTSLEDAQALALSLVTPLPVEQVALSEAQGRWLAAPLIARRTQPAADLSAMDGFAVSVGPGPWQVTASIPAEAPSPDPLATGQAARIFTGAPVPPGTHAILIQENARSDGDCLTATTLPDGGQWIRRAGQDFSEGDTLADSGTPVTPALIALAAIAGHATLAVCRRPAVSLLASGSELVEPGSPNPGLPDANSPMLAALLAGEGFATADLGIIADQLAALTTTMASFNGDLLITSGGASVGDHDLIRPALEASGWSITLHRIAMKPGKPLIIARRGAQLMLGLPGNPVSAFVTATLFALPMLRAMAGSGSPLPTMRLAPLATPMSAGGNRTEFLRATFDSEGHLHLHPGIGQDSAALLALSTSSALVRREIDAPPQPIGSIAAFIPIGL